MRKKLFYIVIFLFISLSSMAQSISMEETIRYINNKLGADCSLDVVKGKLMAFYYDKGKLDRKDKVNIAILDTNRIGFEKEGNILFISCKENEYDGVERILLKDNIKKQYSRISFVIPSDDKSVEGMKAAFGHMLRLIQRKNKYERTQPFE